MVIRSETPHAHTPGEKASFAVRPEKLRVSRTKPESGVNATSGEVWDIGYLGDMTVYNVKLAGGQIVRSSELNRHRTSEDPLTWNDRAWLTFPADAGVVLTR
jgi:putrescine transport system ATP-binding protein